MKTRTNSKLELLRARRKDIDEKVAAEQVRLGRRLKREAEKERALIAEAVIKAALASPQFRLAVSQAALAQITDPKQRAFLASRGWSD